MGKRLHRFVGALALLPLLLVAVAAPAYAMRCRTTGAVMALCACPTATTGVSDPMPATIGAQTCCELHKVETVQPASELSSSRFLLAPEIVAELPIVLQAPAPQRPVVALARPPAHGRPPVLLTKTVLLI